MDFSALFFLLYLKKSGIPLKNIEKKFIEVANNLNAENEKQEMLKGWEEIKKFLEDNEGKNE